MSRKQVTLPLIINLPGDFTPFHEDIIIRYLADQLHGRDDWRLATEAFGLLDSTTLTTDDNTVSLREFYRYFVDERFADRYLQALLGLTDVRRQSPTLWAEFARQIVQAFRQLPWQVDQQTGSRLCLSYLLYWWNAFARGYAFEVEIFQDLERVGIQFQAHNLLDCNQRFSPSDLTVIGQAGDIKTSTYFLHIVRVPTHDFYVVRFANQGRFYTIVVMLQPSAWEAINGDTVDGDLSSVLKQLPRPIRISSDTSEFVIIEYNEWQQRILRRQGNL